MNGYINVLKYIKHTISETGCQIVIKDFVGFIAKDPDVAVILSPYFVHKSSYCMYIKSHRGMWARRLNTNNLLQKKCGHCGHYFVGTCYSGCSEVVIPVKYNGRAVAAICIYGFKLDEKRADRRIEKVISKYKINGEKARLLYMESVKEADIDIEQIVLRCGILADFFRMYYKALANAGTVNPHEVCPADTNRLYILSNAIEFIRMHFAEDIKIADIAGFCRCSGSYISHIFKKNMNQNISRYINEVRVEKAKELIAGTSRSVNEISGRCGFSDPNYFSSVFRRITGLPPSMYKKVSMKGGNRVEVTKRA
jgi:AraC-like DNA-binding protein